MSLQQALSHGVQTTVVGLSIVFTVLIILMLVLKLFEKIFYKKPDNQQTKQEEPIKAPKPTVATVVESEDDGELIAILTAAIAASLNTSTYNLKIKSYRRINQNTSAWNRAGVRETIESRMN